ncbi:protein-disulfide reductase DsbD [Campylobacter sp. RM12637]|uniref:protein-disulfide reductase DsbD n=1 Tax=Campylobacter sp. RM12637 TaxID=2735734 RepID=UPI0030152B40|nr:protein-disulfide reductase DsbD [Campylobacter sp. RM12637]
MKFIINILIFCVLAIANPLPPNEAFKFQLENNSQANFIKLNLNPDIYLYKNEIKVLLNNENITNKFDLSNAVLKDNVEVFYNTLEFDFPNFTLKNNDNIKIFYLGCSTEGLCYQPLVASFNYQNDKLVLEYDNKEALKLKKEKQSTQNEYESKLLNSSFLISILTFFVSGILLSLTPCTLPMIPIISSILAKSSGKNPIISSIIYVLGMAISYTIAGIIAALVGSGVQVFFQNPIVIILFSLIFVILSLSMFGLFELKMPNFIVNSVNKKSSKYSGIIGVFLMGVLSALIVGPCVAAPLAGILIYVANSNDVLLGAFSLFFMSIGMGIPLIAIGFGFKFITGSWMQYVNKFFGFILLGIAIFFLERIINENITNILYALLGISFVVFFGLFENTKNKFFLFFKIILVLILAYSFILLNKTFNPSNNISQQNLEFTQAKEKLNLSSKNIVYFTASWCENCKVMQNTTFKDKEVINELKNYNLIKIDLTNPNQFEQEMAETYKVFGPPVLLVLNDKGEVLKQIIGLVDAKTLLKELNF